MKKIFLFIFIMPALFAAAQKKNSPQFFAASISAEDLKKHLLVVASKEMEGRDTPSPGLEKAADYIENQFRLLGLKPGNGNSYRQYYPLYRDSMLSSTLKINGKAFEINKDYQPSATLNYSGELKISQAVFAGYGIVDGDIDHYKNLEVMGKVVVIVDGFPAGYKPSVTGFNSPSSSFGKLSAAQKRGAIAVLVIGGGFPRRTMNPAGGWTMNGYKNVQFPMSFTISENVAVEILGENAKGILDKMKNEPPVSKAYKADIDLGYSKITKTTNASNVLAALEGTDKKDEWVVITAHYDHIGKRNDTVINYGADDDGSGTVSVLELAEAYAKAKAAGKGPRRSILFMTVSGEEKGLWGSAYYSNHPVYPLEKTTVDLNIDMIGRTGSEYMKDKDSTNYVYVIGDDKLSTDLTPITDQVNSKYMKMKLDRKYNDPNDPNRFYFRSDHYNFAEKGVPVIFYFNGTHADYHRPTDTPEKINYRLMAKRAQLVFFTAWEMANREEMLKRDIKLEVPRGF
jgi:hypothetical protein